MNEQELREGLRFVLDQEKGYGFCVRTRTALRALFLPTCNKCRASVNLGPLPEGFLLSRNADYCPCNELGPEEALKRAALYLEEAENNEQA
ncbi:hypothetical protein LCGC14_3132740 [marine sediment metagenome]|uniref:Uncharacterized protein n=1 Tax=marine sediment metagenome TaxID=412755 RepID=A0A0F8Y667_9ZZZZ